MRTHFVTLIAACMLMGMGSNMYAQKQGQVKWRKTVIRNIELENKKTDTVKLAGNKTREVTLAEALANEIRAGRLAAYSNIDHNFSTRLLPNDRNYTINPRNDTIEVANPVTNEKKYRVIHQDLDLNVVHRYRTLEEWEYDPATGTTEIRISGIAPVRDVYGDDGILRGVQAVFWVKYTDAVGTIMKYEKEHPKHQLMSLVWNDNFNDNVQNSFHTMALRRIDLKDKDDTAIRHFKDAGPEESITDIANDLIKNGTISIYYKDDYAFSGKIPPQKVREMTKRDTVQVVDPVDGTIKEQVRESDSYFNENSGIVEQWNFNILTGRINVKALALAAYNHIYVANNKAVTDISFILKPDDLKPYLAMYDQYHPTATFAGRVWDNYFFSDTKPELIK